MILGTADFRWAMRLGVIGAAISFLLVLTLRFTGSDIVFFLLHDFSYLAVVVGEKLFESARERPTEIQAILFDLFVISFTGLQWFLVGRVIDLVRGFRRKTVSS
ncbi:MAG: hypothetical protein ACRD4T_07575 [Candidatus Acidiferrales bacterium]